MAADAAGVVNYRGVLDYNLSEDIIIFLCGSHGGREAVSFFWWRVNERVCVRMRRRGEEDRRPSHLKVRNNRNKLKMAEIQAEQRAWCQITASHCALKWVKTSSEINVNISLLHEDFLVESARVELLHFSIQNIEALIRNESKPSLKNEIWASFRLPRLGYLCLWSGSDQISSSFFTLIC